MVTVFGLLRIFNVFNVRIKIDNTNCHAYGSNKMDYSNKTIKDLIAFCKEKGVKGYSGKKKDAIIQLLTSAPTVTENVLIDHSTDSDDSDVKPAVSFESLLQQVVKNVDIETNSLFRELCNVNKVDHTQGVYYTLPSFFKELLGKLNLSHVNDKTSTLDFCCGTGNLYIGYLDALKTTCSEAVIKNIIVNSRFVDIDESAIVIFKLKLYCWIKNNMSVNIPITDYIGNFHVNDALLDISLFKGKFDVVLSNPPFINLKSNVQFKKKIKDLNYYKHSIHGMMDTYLLSIERILDLLETNGRVVIICPSQILTNISCFNLRKHMLDAFSVQNVFKFPEKNSIFPTITQSICVLDVVNTTAATDSVVQYHTCDYTTHLSVNNTNSIRTDIYKSNNYNIIDMTAQDVVFLTKLSAFPKITAYPSMVKCARGNIDVTLDKDVIRNEKTQYPLVRGRNIQSLDTITEYITSETIEEKKINVTSKKLVCQQICNMGSQNRLAFTIVDANFVISNSCNYILVNDDKYLVTVNHILNSRVLNRFFTIFSGNNHVSINEIYNLPFPNIFETNVNLEDVSLDELDSKIYELYGLDNAFVAGYFSMGASNKRIVLYNHISQKLSDMEQTMATYIKPGGNWKDIPASLTASERLNNIRKTGGRTTLYGRLEYSKPGFTITTQFSRLPNSSNLHPCKNRMITIREAGLIQSFPIDFKFSENKSVAITQIGNAVPPLLARFLANLIKNDVANKNTLDLFSGVGGMSVGFSQEGFNIVLSNELDEKLANEKENKKYHKNTIYVCGDICDSKIKSAIKEKLADTTIGVIIGGPPCQGFSLAGKRDSDDKRNKLYLDYFQMIETYNPECFVMENVKGILSMKNEANQLVIEEIKGIATKLGYKVSVFKLNACDFAVPQKRERVFVIGHKTKLYEAPNAVIRKEKYITVKDAIGFLEPFEENAIVDIPATAINNPYIKYLSDIISLEELYKSYS